MDAGEGKLANIAWMGLLRSEAAVPNFYGEGRDKLVEKSCENRRAARSTSPPTDTSVHHKSL